MKLTFYHDRWKPEIKEMVSLLLRPEECEEDAAIEKRMSEE